MENFLEKFGIICCIHIIHVNLKIGVKNMKKTFTPMQYASNKI